MTLRILKGVQSAAVVFHATNEVARQVREHGLVDPRRLVHAPLGVAREFSAVEDSAPVDPMLSRAAEMPFVMHVGSCIARKRIDVLLDVFAELRRARSELRLVKIGGEWTDRQLAQQRRLGIEQSIVHLHALDRRALAWLYRRAFAVLMTSDAEGFGLPMIEALACGAPVVASDIAAMREVGGDAVAFCPVGDIGAWVSAVIECADSTTKELRIAQASKYSWQNHARIVAETYLKLIEAG
jgi:glycosyltransferase involved in cell wall biosynthesis